VYGIALIAEVERTEIPCLWAVQPAERRGALFALELAMDALGLCGQWQDILVLFGDMPGWQPETIRTILEHHQRNRHDATVGVADLRSPAMTPELRRHFSEWGRLCLAPGGGVHGIVFRGEVPDEAFARQPFVSPSLYAFSASAIAACASAVRPSGAKQERTMPGLVTEICRRGLRAGSFLVEPREAIGINTLQDLEFAQRMLIVR
jgi:bifunctional N-acetylglucosamine-1-phosphate-uridyltransferase/glucosamine-1-phosphate-acetyltransferase GlmU-like protein